MTESIMKIINNRYSPATGTVRQKDKNIKHVFLVLVPWLEVITDRGLHVWMCCFVKYKKKIVQLHFNMLIIWKHPYTHNVTCYFCKTMHSFSLGKFNLKKSLVNLPMLSFAVNWATFMNVLRITTSSWLSAWSIWYFH